jgi:hypothetical protein
VFKPRSSGFVLPGIGWTVSKFDRVYVLWDFVGMLWALCAVVCVWFGPIAFDMAFFLAFIVTSPTHACSPDPGIFFRSVSAYHIYLTSAQVSVPYLVCLPSGHWWS